MVHMFVYLYTLVTEWQILLCLRTERSLIQGGFFRSKLTGGSGRLLLTVLVC